MLSVQQRSRGAGSEEWQQDIPAGQTHDLLAGTASFESASKVSETLTGGRDAGGGGRPLCCAAASCRNFASALRCFFCLRVGPLRVEPSIGVDCAAAVSPEQRLGPLLWQNVRQEVGTAAQCASGPAEPPDVGLAADVGVPWQPEERCTGTVAQDCFKALDQEML